MLDAMLERDWLTYAPPAAPAEAEAVEMVEIVGSEMPDRVNLPWREAQDWTQLLAASNDLADDDPDALREAGARVVASRLVSLAEWARLHPDRGTREIAALVEEFFAGDHFRDGKSLDTFIGLRPDGGRSSLAREISIYERNTAVRKLAAMEPFRSMKPTMAGKVIRWMFERTHGSRWVWQGDDQPPKITADHRAVLAEIAATGACPSAQSIAEHVRAMRMRSR
jgi:hypothetical protein